MESVLLCDFFSVAYLTGLHFIMWAVQKVNTWESYMWTILCFQEPVMKKLGQVTNVLHW